MARDFDLTSPKWLDMVFKGKNHQYGAYTMRRDSSNRHLWAILITLFIGAGLMFLPGLIKSAIPDKTHEDLGTTIAVDMMDLETELPEENVIEQPIEVPPPPLLKETIQFVPPVVARDEEVADEDQMLTQQELTDTKVDISVATVEGGVKDGVDIADIKDNQVIVQKEEPKKVFERAEQMPQFPGGEAELYKWLNANLVYPPIAAERGMQGTVTLRFVVTETGNIGEVQILRGVDRDLDKEATRVVGKLPKFIPGRQNGQPVSVWFTLPVRFRLQQ